MAAKKSPVKTTSPVKKMAGAFNYYLLQGNDDKRFRLLLKVDKNFKVWSLAKKPSSNTDIKRLAIIEDETDKPDKKNNAILDKGNFISVNQEAEPVEKNEALKNIEKGELKIILNGDLLKGGFVLVQAKTYGNSRWLFIKHKDQFSTSDN